MSKLNPKRFLLEIFSIIFAVLLALALDSWRENLNEQKRIDRALQDIFLEVNSFMALEGALSFNNEQLDLLDSMIRLYEDGATTPFQGGVGRPEVKNLAWETSKESGIASGFNRQLSLDLAEVYVEFDRLQQILEYSREFNLKVDPEMSEYTRARHVRRQIQQTIFRCVEVQRKASDFLEQYKDSKYVNAQ